MSEPSVFRPLYRDGEILRLLDQRLLPGQEVWLSLAKAPDWLVKPKRSQLSPLTKAPLLRVTWNVPP